MKTDKMNLKIFNRDIIKYIAMFTMLLNHIAHINLFSLSPVLYEAFEDIGYFTAPVMCFFLVEGFQCTRSRMRYGLRLLLFAVISQIPFELAFQSESMNMIFTLLLCFSILVAMERISNTVVSIVVCTILVFVSAISDWALVAPVLTILLYQSAGNRRKMAFSYVVICAVFVFLNIMSFAAISEYSTGAAIVHGIASGIGILVAGFTVLFLYNGKRMEYGKNFSKWFFYIFYPAHLLILYLLKTFVLVW